MADFFEENYHKSTFDNIPEEKRSKILSVAVNEFATQGFENANINTIAKKAEVSVGSLYKYFDTKTDLFLTCVGHEISYLGQLLEAVTADESDIMLKFEKLLRAAITFSRENAIINMLYNEFTTESNSLLGITFANIPLARKAHETKTVNGKLAKTADTRNSIMVIALSVNNEHVRKRYLLSDMYLTDLCFDILLQWRIRLVRDGTCQ